MAEKIKRYEVRDQRQGEEAILYKAWDPLLQRHVTIKEPLPHLLGNSAYMESFLNEGKRLGGIDDENVAKFHELILPAQEGSKCYLVTEYVEKSVADLLRQGRVDAALVRNLLQDVLLGLKVIHEKGLVHANIRPTSVLVTPEGKAKITDLRIGGIADSGGMITAGAAKYLPHEILLGDGQVGPWSDLYSLGCLAYEMALGSSRFAAQFSTPGAGQDDDMRYREWHCDLSLKAKPLREIDSSIPEDLSALVARLMEKAIEKRYPSADEALGNLGVVGAGAAKAAQEKAQRAPAPPPEPADESAGMFTRPLMQVVLDDMDKQEKPPAPAPAAAEERSKRRASPAPSPARTESKTKAGTARESEKSASLRNLLIIVGAVVIVAALVFLMIR